MKTLSALGSVSSFPAHHGPILLADPIRTQVMRHIIDNPLNTGWHWAWHCPKNSLTVGFVRNKIAAGLEMNVFSD
jgi:hypothetical protein